MGDTSVSPQSQGSRRREDYQPVYHRESLSIGGLIQNCATELENECENLEREVEQKTSALNELKKLVEKQSENISKQRSELEHLKVLSHKEVMNREAFIAKNSTLREKSEVLQTSFSSWFKDINLLLFSKEQLNEFLKKKMIQEENYKKMLREMDKPYKSALADADTSSNKLETLRDREQSEFNEVKAYMRAQLNIQEQKERELEGKLREIQGNCREKETMMNMLTPQNAELNKTLEKLNFTMATEVKEIESTTTQLQTVMQSELKRKEEFTENIDAMDKKIYETNNNIRDREEEIKEFDSKQKQLITKEEENTKTLQNEMEKLKNLQSKYEQMKEQFSILLSVEEENYTLKLEFDKLEETAESTKVKIKETENIENSYTIEIEKIEKSIEEMETKKYNILAEKQAIEEKVRELEKEMNENRRQHEISSEEIDKPFIELTKRHESINRSLSSLSAELKTTNEEKVKFDETVNKLKVELDRSIAIATESDSKLFSQYQEFSKIYADLKNKDCNLDDMIAKAVQDNSKAESDILLSEEIKFDIQELIAKLENEKLSFQSSLEHSQESQKSRIQAKIQEMADVRIQYEREFRNKEQSKTDVLVELKENKARIIDLQKQKIVTARDIQNISSNIVKCESLVRKLESKLKRVARVATEETHSQTFPTHQYPSNQSTNLLDSTPQTFSRGIKRSNFPSPSGSQSSAYTVNLDEVDIMKIKRKNASRNKLEEKLQTKKSLKEKKQEFEDSFATWGF